MVTKPYQLLIFDWDGTLMDSIGRIVSSMQATAAALELPVPKAGSVRDIIGLSLEPAIGRLFGQLSSTQYAQFLAVYRAQYVELDTTPTPLFSGVPAMLAELGGQGYQLAVATGKARRGLDRVLRECGLESAFTITRCADESRSKPDPHMLHEIMAYTGIEQSATLMIGDSIHDLRMAQAAGVDALGVDFGAHSAELLLTCEPRGIISDWSQLAAFLQHGKQRSRV
ncbi:HAD-IA family hydrolase [Pseudidiomarina sp.]|uniref:HAD-IA family hydrolase n=1 Tax=Pseudidiomarina sp. TaxID=2081707 RepID=UPI003A96AE07